MSTIASLIAQDLGCRESQVNATIDLLSAGATIPFIARYRKEATGGLDDAQLRFLEERLGYLRDLEDRRSTILKSIDSQGKLTGDLRARIDGADTKAKLEDIYLPYRPKRRTKATTAREAGLEPLANALLENPGHDPETKARSFVDADKGITNPAEALEGARHILIERFAEHAELVGTLREMMWSEGILFSNVIKGKSDQGNKFTDYFDHREPVRHIAGHRALAMFRGAAEGVLRLSLRHPDSDEKTGDSETCLRCIASRLGIGNKGRASDTWLVETVRAAWKNKLSGHIETDITTRLREKAEKEAIQVFAANLKDVLMAAPAGMRTTLALDPGYRTGVKVAVIDQTGKVLETTTIYPHEPRKQWNEALATLGRLVIKHQVQLIAVGNGTASRETDTLTTELIRQMPEQRVTKVTVSEAGASVYSASAWASRELPDLDVSLRGAVSIGRRLQDPLAELVKIDPKSIGVGQYQHDLSQPELARALDVVVEDAVNAVGVDLNTASVPLLSRVAGLSERLAENIVAFRDSNGAFKNRRTLLKVAGLGPKTFEQCAGFLRIFNGDEPLDASAVHPEAYSVVQNILTVAKTTIAHVIGNLSLLHTLRPESFANDRFGTPTVIDILKELEKPGRDPRPEFRTAQFRDGVEKMADLEPGMILEGTITNVANFGAFVDIGVHQDGLIHISALSDRFVKDPRSVVKVGDVVKVKVLDVDLQRKRIALTRRMDEEPSKPRNQPRTPGLDETRKTPRAHSKDKGNATGQNTDNALAHALTKAGWKTKPNEKEPRS